MLFRMNKNAYFNGSVDSNPYKFRHEIKELSLFVNGKRVPREGQSLDTDHEKNSVMGYRTL